MVHIRRDANDEKEEESYWSEMLHIGFTHPHLRLNCHPGTDCLDSSVTVNIWTIFRSPHFSFHFFFSLFFRWTLFFGWPRQCVYCLVTITNSFNRHWPAQAHDAVVIISSKLWLCYGYRCHATVRTTHRVQESLNLSICHSVFVYFSLTFYANVSVILRRSKRMKKIECQDEQHCPLSVVLL